MKKSKDDGFKILCIWCNAPWTARMETDLDYMSSGCDSCGFGGSAQITMKIYCTNCSRLVYSKECKAE